MLLHSLPLLSQETPRIRPLPTVKIAGPFCAPYVRGSVTVHYAYPLALQIRWQHAKETARFPLSVVCRILENIDPGPPDPELADDGEWDEAAKWLRAQREILSNPETLVGRFGLLESVVRQVRPNGTDEVVAVDVTTRRSRTMKVQQMPLAALALLSDHRVEIIDAFNADGAARLRERDQPKILPFVDDA